MVRLQKFMADCGVASRRASEDMIRNGLVFVNGLPAQLGQSVDPEKDCVTVDGKPIRMQRKRVVCPTGSTMSADLISIRKDCFS